MNAEWKPVPRKSFYAIVNVPRTLKFGADFTGDLFHRELEAYAFLQTMLGIPGGPGSRQAMRRAGYHVIRCTVQSVATVPRR